MCTTVILRRPGHAWPLILAANRDEMKNRPWQMPGRHWPSRPDVVAGLDEEAGGSWLGVNDYGVVAAILNRRGSLGPQSGKRSRGELVLEALDHADARNAAQALRHLDPSAYRSFNLVVADNRDAFWLRNLGDSQGHGGQLAGGESGGGQLADGQTADGPSNQVETFPIPIGLSMLTARDINDLSSPRIERYLARFRSAPSPRPEDADWWAWQVLLSERAAENTDPNAAMTVVTDSGFETTSSSLLALPAAETDAATKKPIWLFAPGRPDLKSYHAIEM